MGSFLPYLCATNLPATQWQPAPAWLLPCWCSGLLHKRTLTKVQIYIRCMVLPLGYSQEIFPDLMGVQFEMIWVEDTLASYPLQFLTVTQYPKDLRQWSYSISLSDPRLLFVPQAFSRTFPFSGNTITTISWDPLVISS